jgi:hypothetical protein
LDGLQNAFGHRVHLGGVVVEDGEDDCNYEEGHPGVGLKWLEQSIPVAEDALRSGHQERQAHHCVRRTELEGLVVVQGQVQHGQTEVCFAVCKFTFQPKIYLIFTTNGILSNKSKT